MRRAFLLKVEKQEIIFIFNFRGQALKQANQTFAHGICLPASCSNTKIVEFLGSLLKKADVQAIGAQCSTDEHEPFNAVDFAAAYVNKLTVFVHLFQKCKISF